MAFKHKSALLCGLILAIAASSCTSDRVTVPKAAIAEEAASEVSIAVEDESTASSIQVTDAGIGDLTASTPFETEAIQAIFPELIVSTTTESAEGMKYPVIVVSDSDTELMRIEPIEDKIYRVTALSSQISGPSGHSIGETFSNIYGNNIPDYCSWVIDSPDDLVTCLAPSSQDVRYLFAGNWDYVYDQVPANAELSNGTLQEITWSPPNY